MYTLITYTYISPYGFEYMKARLYADEADAVCPNLKFSWRYTKVVTTEFDNYAEANEAFESWARLNECLPRYSDDTRRRSLRRIKFPLYRERSR